MHICDLCVEHSDFIYDGDFFGPVQTKVAWIPMFWQRPALQKWAKLVNRKWFIHFQDMGHQKGCFLSICPSFHQFHFILIPLKMAQVKEPFYARFRRNIHQKGMLFLISIKKVGPHWWHNLPKWGFLGGFYRHKDGLRHCFTNKCRCHLSVQWPIWAASCSWYVFDAYNTTSHNMLVLLNELTTKAYTDTYIYTYIFQY